MIFPYILFILIFSYHPNPTIHHLLSSTEPAAHPSTTGKYDRFFSIIFSFCKNKLWRQIYRDKTRSQNEGSFSTFTFKTIRHKSTHNLHLHTYSHTYKCWWGRLCRLIWRDSWWIESWIHPLQTLRPISIQDIEYIICTAHCERPALRVIVQNKEIQHI